MKLITKEEIMSATANLLGKSEIPNGDVTDWERFAQHALDYAWRYHTWAWTLKRGALLAQDGRIVVPEDFDYYGYRVFEGITEGNIFDGGDAIYLEYDEVVERYTVVNGEAGTGLVYQVQPPELTEEAKIPFPSALTIAEGALIMAKQGENPRSADVQQEWDIFHVELDKHVALQDKFMPQPTNITRTRRRTRHDVTGRYPGQVR